MHQPLKSTISVMALFVTTIVSAQTPAEIFSEMDARKRATFDGIDNYTQMKTTMGLCTIEHFDKESVASADGRGTVEYMRLVPLSEINEGNASATAASNASPEDLEFAAQRLREQGPAMDQLMRDEMQSAGLPGGLSQLITNPPSDKPWLSPMPSDMLGNYAMMLEAAAEGERQDARRKADAATAAETDPLAGIADRTRVVGRETINNRTAIKMVAEDLNHRQQADGQEFTMNTLYLWVDAERYVPLKMQIDGVVREGNETREMRIEREDSNHESVPGCGDMYEPHRTVMRIAGVLSPQEEAQMAEAQVKMAEFEAQMASMPAAQRDMIMRQMGPQLEMFRNMASGKGIEVVSMVTGMRCNAGLPSTIEMASTLPGNAINACVGLNRPTNAGPPVSSSGISGGDPGGNSSGSQPPAPDNNFGNPSPTPEDSAGNPASTANNPVGGSSPAQDPDASRAAQQACLQEKMAAAQDANKKKRGFGRLMSAVARTAGNIGNHDLSRTMGAVYNANATADDLSAAAKDLGLTEEDVAACQNPG